MEYPFKDLLPLDEVLEREGYYKDWKHLDPKVFYSLTQISEYIKTKGFGVDVRLLIAQLAEHFGLRVTQITDAMNEFIDLKPKAELSISRSLEALTKSSVALTKSQNALNVANGIDGKATNALSLSESADTLSKSVQDQFNQVVIDGDSSVESAQARVDASGQTNATLKARLDKEYNEVTAQLAEQATILKPEMTTIEIQDKIDSGGYFRFKKGLYSLDLIHSGSPLPSALNVPSNTTLEFEKGAVITTPPNDLDLFSILTIHNQENVSIIGGEIKGERNDHTGTTGEWGMGLSIYSSFKIKIDGTIFSDHWGDGIYITSNTVIYPTCGEIYIRDVICDNNRRQGMSVETVDGLYVSGSQFNNTSGTSPQAGIDFEPYKEFHYIDTVFISDTLFKNNTGYGILIATASNIRTQTRDMFMEISNCIFEGNNFVISNFKDGCGGVINLNNPIFKRGRILRNFTTKDFPRLNISNALMVDPCYGNENGTEFNKSAILLYNNVADVRSVPDGTGGIKINGLRIIENEKIMDTVIYLYDNDSEEFHDINLLNIEKYTPSGFNGSNRVINAHKVVDLNFDDSPFFRISPTAYIIPLDRFVLSSSLDNEQYGSGTLFVELTNDYPIYKPVTILVRKPSLIVIRPLNESTQFTPLNLRSNTVGNSVTIMKVSENEWVVTNKHGEWTTV